MGNSTFQSLSYTPFLIGEYPVFEIPSAVGSKSIVPDISDNDLQEAVRNLRVPGSKYENKITSHTKTVNGVDRDKLYSEMRDVLFNKLRSRPWARNQDENDLLSLQEVINDQLEVFKAEREREKELQLKKAKFLDELEMFLAEREMSVADLETLTEGMNVHHHRKPSGSKGAAQPKAEARSYRAKYKISIFDKEYLWAGLGQTPTPFKCFIAKGHDLEQFKLDPETAPMLQGKQDFSFDEKYASQAMSLLQTWKKGHRKGKM